MHELEAALAAAAPTRAVRWHETVLLRAQYRQLQDSIASLQRGFEKSDDAGVDTGDIRQRLALLLTGLRHQRGRESDLIYEAYYEAFRADLRQHAQDLAGGAGA